MEKKRAVWLVTYPRQRKRHAAHRALQTALLEASLSLFAAATSLCFSFAQALLLGVSNFYECVQCIVAGGTGSLQVTCSAHVSQGLYRRKVMGF